MEIKVSGLTEALAFMDQAPKLIVVKGFKRALQAGGNVLGAEVAIRTPIREGDLLANINLQITLDSQFRGGTAVVSFGKMDFRAAMVEYGHNMVGHLPGKKNLGRVPAHPFVRPAAVAAAEKAIIAFQEELVAAIGENYGRP